MPEEKDHILEDLRDVVKGEVYGDAISRAAFSTDASLLQVQPRAIVAPRSIEEVSEIVKYAAENDVALHPRGAGTGLAGESLGPSLVVDLSRHFTRIVETTDTTVRVQPGVRLAALQDHLEEQGRMFGPNPLSGDRCTLGGMIGTDAAGPHSLRYGTTRHHVLKLRVVFANGQTGWVGKEPISDPQAPTDDHVRWIVAATNAVLDEYSEDVPREQPQQLPKPGGYCLRGLRDEKTINLARLLVGSEGTLGVVVEAELGTLPVPLYTGILLACFPTIEDAAHAAHTSLAFQPTACEMLDRRLASMVRESSSIYAGWIPESAEALLIIEQEGISEENVADRLSGLRKIVREHGVLGTPVSLQTEQEQRACWGIRNTASTGLMRTRQAALPVPFIENTAVPPQEFPRYLRIVQDVMKHHGVTATYTAHAGVGILHTRPLLDLDDPSSQEKLEPIAEEVFRATTALGGTIFAEHGSGLLRAGYVDRQFPRLSLAFRKLKAIFDPHNILNPGRIVAEAAGLPVEMLRVNSVPTAVEKLQPQLRWNQIPILREASRCNGCASCMAVAPEKRMCPTFSTRLDESSGTRIKANLMRQFLMGQLDPRMIDEGELRQVADLCVNCKMCRLECPSGVDVSRLMIEAKARDVAQNGLERPARVFAHLDAWAARGSSTAVLTNALLSNPISRWFVAKLTGVTPKRPLPRLHHGTFLRRAHRLGWTKKPRVGEPRPRVALLVDTAVNYTDPRLAEYVGRILEHLGRKVYVPPGQGASGVLALQYGDLEKARACLEQNIPILADLAREGYDIVSPEPSTVLMIRQEAESLLDDPDLDLVAQRSFEFSEYLAVQASQGELRGDLAAAPMTVAYHEPCHLRALRPRASMETLMELVPQLRLISMDAGCSGMALTWGMHEENEAESLEIGRPMLQRLAASDVHFGMSQCSACRMQMEYGSGKRTLHPAHLLAVSYRLVNRPDRLLARPSRKRVRP